MSNLGFVDLQGKCKWAKLHQPDDRFHPPKYRIDLYPNEEAKAKIKEMKETSNGVTGIKNTWRKDDDGDNMTFSRPVIMHLKNGSSRTFAPPRIVDKDGVTPLPNTMLGNGSDVTIRVEYYSHGTPGGGKAKAARLEAVKVDNLVPYESPRDMGAKEFKVIKDLDKAPPQKPSW